MRKASVLLVFFLASFVSGFIVPSSAPEFITGDNVALVGDDATKLGETKMSSTSAYYDVLPTDLDRTNRNYPNLQDNTAGIDEKVLYEYATEKANNVNERSFLFINQRFKTPIGSQLYNSQFQDLSLPMKSKQMQSNTGIELPMSMEFPNRLATGFFQPSIDEYVYPNIVQTEYNHRCNDNNKLKDINDIYASKNKHTKKTRPHSTNKGTEDQRSYLELLKPPLLRPQLNHNDNRLNFDDKVYTNSPSAEFSLHNNLKTNQKHPKLQALANIDHNPPKTVDEFSRLHSNQKPIFVSNPFNYGPHGNSFKNKHRDGIEAQRTANNNDDDDRQLDRFLKDSYEEQIANERRTMSYNDCNYRDCVIAAGRQQSAVQPYANNKPECNCRIKHNRGTKKPNIQRDRLERQGMVYGPTHLSTSSVINDFEDTQEENPDKSVNDELLKTVNKLNDTLQMYL